MPLSNQIFIKAKFDVFIYPCFSKIAYDVDHQI